GARIVLLSCARLTSIGFVCASVRALEGLMRKINRIEAGNSIFVGENQIQAVALPIPIFRLIL
ncbi:MAG: hypothetical protein DMF68_20825, partial [Acidobacteria bacterium]